MMRCRNFVADNDPRAYEKLIDRLLASPRYGERWGRYWLDVARYGEDNPTAEATNPPYPFAWRYRDWVIEATRPRTCLTTGSSSCNSPPT